MKIQALKTICLFVFILASATSSSANTCPFDYLYHVGDGVTDIGNSIKVLPWGPNLPAAHLPYGITTPGYPTGRWSDGLIDFDFAAIDFGLPNVVPYLSWDSSTANDGVIFSVARSTVLDHEFYEARGIQIPPFAIPLKGQMEWFRTYLKTVCSTPEECATRLANSLVFFGDVEANDIGYALTQGKSIQEVETYVPFIVDSQIDYARELISLGATKILIPPSGPLGCAPYVLTALYTGDPTDYDEIGCLKSVNDFIITKNRVLDQAIKDLRDEFPSLFIGTSDLYNGLKQIITEAATGPHGELALKSCCGIGGNYNYDSQRFCGQQGVPVCDNPNEYVYWDGIHFTEDMFYRMEHLLVQPALQDLNCTVTLSAFM